MHPLWQADDYAHDAVLAIDFANTLSWRGRPKPDEFLPDCGSWIEWSREHGLLTPDQAMRLRSLAAEQPDEATAAFHRAIEFREALYNLLSANCHGNQPPAKDRMLVQDVLNEAMGQLRLAGPHDGWRFELAVGACEWDSPLFGPALSAAQLLTGEYAGKLRSCERDECRWLFLDHTKNHSRKWCDMKTCGNVVKARASYDQKKQFMS